MGFGLLLSTLERFGNIAKEANKIEKLNALIESFQKDPSAMDLENLKVLGQGLQSEIGRERNPELERLFNAVDLEIREKPFRWGNNKKGA